MLSLNLTPSSCTYASQADVRLLKDTPIQGALLAGGIDCYGYCPQRGWCWVGQQTPWRPEGVVHDGRLNSTPLDGKRRRYRYCGIGTPYESVEIGTNPGAELSRAPLEDTSQLIVAYGTSIVHGWTVGRPGMAHPAIMARGLDRPIIPLGFAGNARMEVALAELLGELNPSVYTVDCLPNMNPELISERFRPFLDALRAKRPDTPILFIGDRVFGDHAFCPQRGEHYRAKNRAQEAAFLEAERDGVPNIGLLSGVDFLALTPMALLMPAIPTALVPNGWLIVSPVHYASVAGNRPAGGVTHRKQVSSAWRASEPL